jgi:hypothetical protein
VEYDTWYNEFGLTDIKFAAMLKTVTNFQMTVGCSNYCKRCNEWAIPFVRKHFTFDAFKRITKELFDAGNSDFVHYGASDPLDWRYNDKSFVDVAEFMAERGYESKYGFLTKIPKGSERVIEKLSDMDADMAVSITDKNRSRVEKIEKKIGKKFKSQHDTDDLLIPAGRDEDFSSVKSSITDNYGTEITPEGAFLIVPTFTSALNLTGQCRIPVTKDTGFFLKRRVGRDSLLVEYFKPLKAIDVKGREFTLDRLLEPQIENILLDNGNEELTPPGMMNLSEYFKIFEKDAVEKRELLLPSVVKGLEEKLINHGGNDESRQKRCDLFLKQVKAYSEFCRMGNIAKYKKNAFSFYLKHISDYLKKYPVKKEIILHLRRKDKNRSEKDQHLFSKNKDSSIESMLEELSKDTYKIFQFLMFKLVDDPHSEIIQKFIKKNPAVYDAQTDMFVCDSLISEHA